MASSGYGTPASVASARRSSSATPRRVATPDFPRRTPVSSPPPRTAASISSTPTRQIILDGRFHRSRRRRDVRGVARRRRGSGGGRRRRPRGVDRSEDALVRRRARRGVVHHRRARRGRAHAGDVAERHGRRRRGGRGGGGGGDHAHAHASHETRRSRRDVVTRRGLRIRRPGAGSFSPHPPPRAKTPPRRPRWAIRTRAREPAETSAWVRISTSVLEKRVDDGLSGSRPRGARGNARGGGGGGAAETRR